VDGHTARLAKLAVVLALMSLAGFSGSAGAQTPGVTTQVLAYGHTDYAEVVAGPADVVMAAITLEPGSSTGWHTHAGPVWAVVTRGELTIYEQDNCRLAYPTGSVRVEVPGDVHEGRNEGAQAVELLVTYIVPAGRELATAATASTALCRR
jgi:quercetin dioxygenase-like cupin family protein